MAYISQWIPLNHRILTVVKPLVWFSTMSQLNTSTTKSQVCARLTAFADLMVAEKWVLSLHPLVPFPSRTPCATVRTPMRCLLTPFRLNGPLAGWGVIYALQERSSTATPVARFARDLFENWCGVRVMARECVPRRPQGEMLPSSGCVAANRDGPGNAHFQKEEGTQSYCRKSFSSLCFDPRWGLESLRAGFPDREQFPAFAYAGLQLRVRLFPGLRGAAGFRDERTRPTVGWVGNGGATRSFSEQTHCCAGALAVPTMECARTDCAQNGLE